MASKTYYECHITIEASGDITHLKDVVEALGWKFSMIDGDPNLGAGVKCYATRQFNARESQPGVMDKLAFASAAISRRCKTVKVVRRKLEMVLYDDRSASVNLGEVAQSGSAQGS